MNFRNYKVIALIVLLISSVAINAQTYKYEILAKNKKIGTIEGTITKKDNLTNVDIIALGEIDFILKEHIKYKLNSMYKDGELIFSSATIFLNNKTHFSSVVKKEDDYYIIDKNEHKESFTDPIHYSGALLYFIEPKAFKRIFSEIDNVEKDIIKESKDTYKIINPATKNASYFTYENGILETANIHHTYIDVRINRIE